MKKILFIFLGTISLATGIAGIIIPGLPTTPFLLLSSYLFLRSSNILYKWLTTHRVLSLYITPFIKYKAISLKGKITSIVSMWSVMLISIIFFLSNPIIEIIVVLCGISVSLYIDSIPNLTKEIIEDYDHNKMSTL